MSSQPANPELYKVCSLSEGTLFVMPKPDKTQLHDDIAFYKSQGVTKVVSLLHAKEIETLGMMTEGQACSDHDMDFANFPIIDMSVPDVERLKAFHKELKQDLSKGAGIAIHCHGGRGRAGIVAITLMIEHGFEAQQAIDLASTARGDRMPVNDEQRQFIHQYQP